MLGGTAPSACLLRLTNAIMNILVLNIGKSEVKFQAIATDQDAIALNTDRRLARGIIQHIGGEATVDLASYDNKLRRSAAPLKNVDEAVQFIIRWLCSNESGVSELGSTADIHAVGHRVVHGGEQFTKSVLIDDSVIRGIEDCIELAPLHNPSNIAGIKAVAAILGDKIPQVAVFDTAFHQSLPEHAYLYAIPYQLYRRHKIRRYGFHGTSHRYVAYRYRQIRAIPRDEVNLITLHLGNGCSATLIRGGNSTDTSMGLTPLEGLVMGTRSGDIDPAIVDFIASKEGLSMQETETMLNTQSGLLGISGLTDDMRELLEEARENHDRRAKLAIEIFCYRAKKYIGAYLAAADKVDAVVFAGGIGENSPEIRRKICEGLEWFGLELDENLNEGTVGGMEGPINKEGSRLAAYVIPTDEELLIARDTVRCVLNIPHPF